MNGKLAEPFAQEAQSSVSLAHPRAEFPGAVRGWLAAGGMCAFLFAADLAVVRTGHLASVDVSVRSWVLTACNNAFFRGLVLNGISTHPGRDSVWLLSLSILAVAAFLVYRRRPWSAALLISSVAGAIALSALLKTVVVRPASLAMHPGHTYPSGHAAGSLAVFATLTHLVWQASRRILLTLVVACGSLAGVAAWGISTLLYHFPTEVLGGYALAGTWLSFLSLVLASRLRSEASAQSPRTAAQNETRV
jgi:membrane-associated phospholipid phosphatase